MADQTSQMHDLAQLKIALEADPNEVLQYGNYKVSTDKSFIYLQRIREESDTETKWKVHVSVLPPRSGTPIDNLNKGWRQLSELAIHYQIDALKVVHNIDPGYSKQITIYCNNQDKNNLLAFLKDLEAAFTAQNIQPDKKTPEGCKGANGSRYISFRYETFDFNLDRPSIEGAPTGYLSDMHVELAKHIIRNMNTYKCDFERGYTIAHRERERAHSTQKILWMAKFESSIKAKVLNETLFKKELELIVKTAMQFGKDEIPWHNLQNQQDVFGLESLNLQLTSSLAASHSSSSTTSSTSSHTMLTQFEQLKVSAAATNTSTASASNPNSTNTATSSTSTSLQKDEKPNPLNPF